MSGCVRPEPAFHGCLCRIRAEAVLLPDQARQDELAGALLPAVEALRVDPHQHVEAVTRPFGRLPRFHP